MFRRKTFYFKIEKNHRKTLKVISNIDGPYRWSLRSNYVSIHQRHLQFLVREIFKSISQINREFMWSFFKQKRRKGPILNAVNFRGSLVWSNVVAEIKSSNSFFEFKTKVKNL